MRHRIGVPDRKRRGGCRCPEAAAEGVRVEVLLVQEAWAAEHHAKAGTDVVTKHDRAQKLRAARALPFRHRQRRRHYRAAGMGHRARMRVVSLVGMGRHRVGERGIDGAGQERRAYHRRLLGAAEVADIAAAKLAGLECGPRDHGGDGVEDVVLGPLHHRIGQWVVCRVYRILRNPTRKIA